MLKRLLPKQENFFRFFQQAADKLLLASTEFLLLIQNVKNQQIHVDKIAKTEQEADAITDTTFELLHKTFITPFDRYDIHQLTSQLDDILDIINRCAQRFPFYHLNQLPNEAVRLAELSKEATHFLREAIYCLPSLKNGEVILNYCNEINRIETEAHQVVLAGEKDLFLNQDDFKTFFKLKEIYSHTKLIINRCQDVANLIKGIVLEYS